MKYLTLILTLFTLMSCGNSKNASAMQNEKQTMNNISGKYQVSIIGTEDVSEYNLTIEFNDSIKTVSGFSGCNRFSGTYTLNGNTIKFGSLASTRMACMDSVNTIETKMLEALSNTNTINSENGSISLLKDNVNMLSTLQESSYRIEYTATSRGLFNQYIFENGKLSIQKDRTSTPTIKSCTKKEANAILEKIKVLDLEKITTLEAPTEKRFYDGAAIALLEITYLGKTYQTQQFDHGEPNEYIASLISTFLTLAEKQ
ncbi:META domain-containing protein [Xanthomarina spongicola]|uniref:Heat shock protein HslJ n=1 Tax=Xanthomarina spongicola TaxID=570520 RepID=A0A316DS92_9FLAO|nr:META domain-containing protein [Xanthomarina spongicola]PWK20348.1 heat shock protein HslJ [Xanthomarina spongicola]